MKMTLTSATTRRGRTSQKEVRLVVAALKRLLQPASPTADALVAVLHLKQHAHLLQRMAPSGGSRAAARRSRGRRCRSWA